MCIVANPSASGAAPRSAAHALPPQARQQLALDALTGSSVTELARQHDVSRKFVYQQADKAEQALADAFSPAAAADDAVLFYLPVTERWLKRLILALLLICHSSYRGIWELLRDLFHCPRSLGYLHAVAHAAMGRAQALNGQRELSGVRVGAHDEIFQTQQPVLVGVDVESTYCYLLSLEEQRDGITWGVRLLELQDRGFAPQAIIGDGGTGLQAGQDLQTAAPKSKLVCTKWAIRRRQRTLESGEVSTANARWPDGIPDATPPCPGTRGCASLHA
jgi:hypothetical protein